MAKARTARACAGKVGLFKKGLSMTQSPYRAGPYGAPKHVRIVAACKSGRHVQLTPDVGAPFWVDLDQLVFNVRDE